MFRISMKKLLLAACVIWQGALSGFVPALALEDSEGRMTETRLKVALVLGGGGTKGLAHIGVLKVFEREHIPYDLIVGTSMGAVMGGLYAAGVPLSRIDRMVHDHSLASAYNTVPIRLRLLLMPVFFLPRTVGIHPYEGLYRGHKFAKFLNAQAPEVTQDLSKLKIPFYAVASNLLDGQVCIIKHGSLGKALQASSAIPWLRKPVIMDDKLLVDGAPLANLPVKQARELGADIVIAVNVDGPLKPVAQDTFRHLGTVENRTAVFFLTKVDEEQGKAADVLICPDTADVSVLSMSIADADKAILAGENAAEAALPQIRQALQLQGAKFVRGETINAPQSPETTPPPQL
jgi:NTE family protein